MTFYLLQAMNFGSSWSAFMGDMTKETTFEILDYYHKHGVRFMFLFFITFFLCYLKI